MLCVTKCMFTANLELQRITNSIAEDKGRPRPRAAFGAISNDGSLETKERRTAMSVTNIVRAVFPSVHKFVFAALLVTLTQFSYADSDYAASWGPSVVAQCL